MSADEYTDFKKVEEEKEKEDKVVQLAAVVCMKDEIAIHSMACVLHNYIVFDMYSTVRNIPYTQVYP